MTKIGYIKIAMYNYPSILLPRKPIPEVDAKSKSPFLWIGPSPYSPHGI